MQKLRATIIAAVACQVHAGGFRDGIEAPTLDGYEAAFDHLHGEGAFKDFVLNKIRELDTCLPDGRPDAERKTAAFEYEGMTDLNLWTKCLKALPWDENIAAEIEALKPAEEAEPEPDK